MTPLGFIVCEKFCRPSSSYMRASSLNSEGRGYNTHFLSYYFHDFVYNNTIAIRISRRLFLLFCFEVGERVGSKEKKELILYELISFRKMIV